MRWRKQTHSGPHKSCRTPTKKTNQRGIKMLGDSSRLRMLITKPALAALAALGFTGQAAAWSLEEAAAPYKGTTIRTIGEALAAARGDEEARTGIREANRHQGRNRDVRSLGDRQQGDARPQLEARPLRLHPPAASQCRQVRHQRPCRADRAVHDFSGAARPDFKPEEQLYQGLWKEISWYDGKAYGFPFTALTMYAWYRSDLLADPKEKEGFKAKYGYDLGPAQDWKQYRDIAEWFTRPDQGLYGTALQGKRHEALWYEWLNFLYSYGGDMLEVKSGSECGPVIVNSPQAIAATEYYKSLMAFSPPDTLNYFWDDVMALMQQGKVAELIMWNDATYAVAVDENVSTVVGKMGFDLVPQGEGGKVARSRAGPTSCRRLPRTRKPPISSSSG